MRIEIHRQRLLILVCVCLSLALLKMNAAEPAQLGDLRGVLQASFNHDASRLAVLTRAGEFGLWDTKKGTPITDDPTLKKPVNAFVMSPDAREVLVGFKEGGSRVFDASSGSAVSPFLDLSLREDGNAQVVFSPDGGTVVFFGETQASILDVKAGKRITTIPVRFQLEEGSDSTALAIFVSGGAKCLVMNPQGTVTTYETKEWTSVGKPMRHPPAESAYQFGFDASSDGKWIVTYDDPGENGPKGQLQVWDALANKPLGRPLSAVNGMSGRFLPGQNRVLVQSGRGDASVRTLPSMAIAYVIKQHDELDGPKVDVFPNGKWLLAWGPDKKIDLIDAVTGKILTTFSSSVSITGVMIPADSSAYYVSCENSDLSPEDHHTNALQRFSVPDMKMAASTRIPDFVLRQALSPDGRWVMTVQGVTDSEQIVVLEAATLKPTTEAKP